MQASNLSRTAASASELLFALILGAMCLFLALVIVSQAWLFLGLIFGMVGGIVIVLSGLKRLAAIWVLGIPSLFVYINNAASEIPGFTVDRLVFAAICALLLVGVVLRRIPFTPLDFGEKCILALLTVATVSMTLRWASGNATDILKDGSLLATGYFLPLGAYAIARRQPWRNSDIDYLTWGLLLVGGFLGLVGVAQLLFDLTIFNETNTENVFEEGQLQRALGTFSSPWEYGVVTAQLGIVGLFCFVRSRAVVGRLAAVALVAITLVGLALSETRAPWLSFPIGFALFAYWNRAIRPLFFTMILLGVAGIMLAIPILAASGILTERIMDPGPIYNRLALWATAANMILHNPLLGVGFGRTSFAEHAPDYLTSFGDVDASWAIGVGVPHNEFLHIGTLLGVPAVLLFVTLLWYCAKTLIGGLQEMNRESYERDVRACALAVLGIYVFNSFFVDVGPATYVGIQTFFLVGIAMAFSRLEAR